MAWNNLGLALAEARRFEEAIDAHTHARTTYQQAGDIHGQARAWNNLGRALAQAGHTERAREALKLAVQSLRDSGDEHRLALAEQELTELRQGRRWWRLGRR
nr:tetratricopeptide repeat protein [Nocardiopsis sp. CNR-923]